MIKKDNGLKPQTTYYRRDYAWHIINGDLFQINKQFVLPDGEQHTLFITVSGFFKGYA